MLPNDPIHVWFHPHSVRTGVNYWLKDYSVMLSLYFSMTTSFLCSLPIFIVDCIFSHSVFFCCASMTQYRRRTHSANGTQKNSNVYARFHIVSHCFPVFHIGHRIFLAKSSKNAVLNIKTVFHGESEFSSHFCLSVWRSYVHVTPLLSTLCTVGLI